MLRSREHSLFGLGLSTLQNLRERPRVDAGEPPQRGGEQGLL